MNQFQFDQHPHRRLNPLTGNWVLVSPHRTQRPWQGQQETIKIERPKHDPNCYLCPGNQRASGDRNPDYQHTFIFQNDYSAILPETPPFSDNVNPLMSVEAVKGECRVICFSPRHDLTLPQMDLESLNHVVMQWKEQYAKLSKQYKWVQIFENKGATMGCSNPHPHGQIWASDFLPNEPFAEDQHQRQYLQQQGKPLLMDYLDLELKSGERIVEQNQDWVVLVPYWAIWPFETLLIPKRHLRNLSELNSRESQHLSEILKKILTRYDNLFNTEFPYSMGWHGSPGKTEDIAHWQLHAHFYPPLLRSATVRKFAVGYEMLAESQRDITAEQAAQKLRDVPARHYLEDLD